jgi:hypothetical protein
MYHLWINPFKGSEDKSAKEVLRVCNPVPRKELGHISRFWMRSVTSWVLTVIGEGAVE